MAMTMAIKGVELAASSGAVGMLPRDERSQHKAVRCRIRKVREGARAELPAYPAAQRFAPRDRASFPEAARRQSRPCRGQQAKSELVRSTVAISSAIIHLCAAPCFVVDGAVLLLRQAMAPLFEQVRHAVHLRKVSRSFDFPALRSSKALSKLASDPDGNLKAMLHYIIYVSLSGYWMTDAGSILTHGI